MKITKKILILLLILCAASVSASLTDTLTEGETKTYTVNDEHYEVTVSLITDLTSSNNVKFVINGETTDALSEDGTQEIDGIQIQVTSIILATSGGVSQDKVSFALSDEFCGNDICDSDEDCASCNDCACDSGYKCEDSECVEDIDCGDDICGTGEDCEEDECCDGKSVDLDDDSDNCGSCGKECDKDEECVRGKCETYCGNGHCDGDETCGTCGDCDCRLGLECIDDICQETDKCDDESDCDDGLSCTKDICVGKPKECSYSKIKGCESNEECVPQGTSALKKRKPVYCDGNGWIPKKELNKPCKESYECKVDSCVDGLCYELKIMPVKDIPVTPVEEKKSPIRSFFQRLMRFFIRIRNKI